MNLLSLHRCASYANLVSIQASIFTATVAASELEDEACPCASAAGSITGVLSAFGFENLAGTPLAAKLVGPT